MALTIKQLEAALSSNVMIDDGDLSALKNKFLRGELSEGEYLRELKSLNATQHHVSLPISKEEAEDQWTALAKLIEDKELKFSKRASIQFKLGTLSLPIGIAIITASYFAGVLYGLSSLQTGVFCGGIVSILALYSYLLLRVYQQASLAEERLSEKSVALYFMRLSLGARDERQAYQLLEAGTQMFLGHHAAETTPLSKDDFKALSFTPAEPKGDDAKK